MESKFCKIGTLFAALGCAPICPSSMAQTTGNAAQGATPQATLEYASAAPANGGPAAPSAAPPAAASDPAPEVRTEVAPGTAVSGTDLRPALTKELEAMKQRIAELEAEIQSSGATASDAATALQGAKTNLGTPEAVQSGTLQSAPLVATPATSSDLPAEETTKSLPFAYADWTWLNGNARTKDTPLATKYFTPEFRADVNYILDFNHPKDDSMGGSTESFRSDEFQVEQLSFGGDLRINNVRGRFLTMYGMFATTTPRNDASPGRGQWDLADAYRYVSEAWGGYHFDVQHGLNVDAGIFVSYIGLFSYYNFDNWAYQPSFVSSNTPWFFNGLRVQWFPTDKLKIEPWFINGWQSYGRPNGKPGLGGQILYRPKPWISMGAYAPN